MADIGDNTGIGLDIRHLASGIDIVGVYPSGTFNVVGSSYPLEVAPNAAIMNNPHYEFVIMTSGTATNVTGSAIGSVIMFIGAGSYVSKWIYDLDFLTDIGSFV